MHTKVKQLYSLTISNNTELIELAADIESEVVKLADMGECADATYGLKKVYEHLDSMRKRVKKLVEKTPKSKGHHEK